MHEAMFTEADRAVRDAEKEAHDFAANLLMPERRVEALLPHHASLQQILEGETIFPRIGLCHGIPGSHIGPPDGLGVSIGLFGVECTGIPNGRT